MKYTREQLVRHVEHDIYACAICCGTGTDDAEFVEHDENCVFADSEVNQIIVEGLKRMADHTICGRCDAVTHQCPACIGGNGWALTTHTRLMKICDRYRKHGT